MLLIDWVWRINEKAVGMTLSPYSWKFPLKISLSCRSYVLQIREMANGILFWNSPKSASLNHGARTTVTMKDFVWPCVHRREDGWELLLRAPLCSPQPGSNLSCVLSCQLVCLFSIETFYLLHWTKKPQKQSLLQGKTHSCPTKWQNKKTKCQGAIRKNIHPLLEMFPDSDPMTSIPCTHPIWIVSCVRNLWESTQSPSPPTMLPYPTNETPVV